MSSARIFVHPPKGQGSADPADKPVVQQGPVSGSLALKTCLLPVERYDHRRGLKSLQIHKTICSVDGRLWSATPAGLACYDGVNIQMFGRKHGLRSHGLRTLAVHPDNSLWLGTDIGVEVLDISGPLPIALWSDNCGTVNSIDIGREIGIIGTSNGLFFWQGGEKLNRSKNDKLSAATIRSVKLDGEDKAWIVGPGTGLIIMNKSGEIKIVQGVDDSFGSPSVLMPGPVDKDGHEQIMIGYASGIVIVNTDLTVTEKFVTESPVETLLFHDGLVWVGAANILFRLQFRDQKLAAFDTVHEDLSVHHLMIDKFDNVWISTGDQALLRISSLRNTFEDSFDCDIGPVMSIRRGVDGLLVGGANGLRLENGQTTLDWMTVWDSLPDNFGKIWSATENGLYCKINPNFTIPYRHEECDVIAAPCRALVFYQGVLFVSSIRGLAKVDSGGVSEVFDPEGKNLGYVYSLHIGPKGNLWIATLGRGVFVFDGEKMSKVNVNTMAENSNVYALSHDLDGHVYIAHDNVISKMTPDGKTSVLVNADVAIAAWTIKYLEGDRLIAGTSNGLIIYDAQTGVIRRRVSGNFDDVPWEFTTSRSLEIFDNSVIYCGLGSGLRSVHLDDLEQLPMLPEAALSAAEFRGANPTTSGDQILVPTGKWHLQINFKTCWYLDNCTMRTRLRGFEETWSESEPLGPIRFTSLPPGSYALEVQIRSPLAGEGPVREIFSFIVAKAENGKLL